MASTRSDDTPTAPDEVESECVRIATLGHVGPALVVVVVCIALSFLVPALAYTRPWKPGDPVPFWNVFGRPFEADIEAERDERVAEIESLAADAIAVDEPPPAVKRRPLPVHAIPDSDALPRYVPHPEDAKPPVQSIELQLSLTTSDDTSRFLANFLVAGLTVPEPSTWLLLGENVGTVRSATEAS